MRPNVGFLAYTFVQRGLVIEISMQMLTVTSPSRKILHNHFFPSLFPSMTVWNYRMTIQSLHQAEQLFADALCNRAHRWLTARARSSDQHFSWSLTACFVAGHRC